jgi:hypothetical protein
MENKKENTYDLILEIAFLDILILKIFQTLNFNGGNNVTQRKNADL